MDSISFNIKQLAEYLHLNCRTIYKLAILGQIPAFKIARSWRFQKELVDQWICEHSGHNGYHRG